MLLTVHHLVFLSLKEGTCQNATLLEITCHGSFEPHEISNSVVCATSKGSDQTAHMRGLIRAFASPGLLVA